MMKISKKTISLSVLSLALVGGIFVALQATHVTHFFRQANSIQKQKQQEKNFNNKQKEATVNGKGNPSTTDETGQPVESTGTYTPPSSASNITISPEQQSNQVSITTKLAGYSDGSCTLTITNGAKNTSQTASVIYAPDFSTCAGFTIPVSTLGAGSWSINLAVTSGGITTTKSTTFTVK